MRNLLIFSGMLLVALAAYTAARYWQAGSAGYQRVAVVGGCDLRRGPCHRDIESGSVRFSISPTDIPLMQPLSLQVDVQALTVRSVVVEVRGLNMDMGLNRTRLEQRKPGVWHGETILPICSQREMKWEAAVRLDGDTRLEIPFLFHTSRP